jgi:putative ABC transport system permease protein
MLRNYFKTAVRNLLRYKGFSAINILSLTIGIAGCLLIGLFVWDERQFDKLPDSERIYRFYDDRTAPEGDMHMPMLPPMLAPFAQQHFPEVEDAVRLMVINGRYLFEAGNVKAYEEKGMFADSTFFKIFPLKLLQGSVASALENREGIVLTESMARKYFGSTDVLGKTITFAKTPLQVTAVLKDLPAHLHLQFRYLVPMSSLTVPAERMQRWGWFQFLTYVKLRPGSNAAAFDDKLFAGTNEQINDPKDNSGEKHHIRLQPLRDIHLGSADFQFDVAERGNRAYVNALSLIAVFVLVIACFNFVNLATARSFRRAREIGVRKVVGAGRRQLLVQFTSETVLLALIAVCLATLLTLLVLPALNHFTGKEMSFNPVLHPLLLPGLLASGIVIGILAGIYPALVLSGFEPVKVLKGSKGNGGGGLGLLRQGLVVLQFALSALLIVCALSVYRQVDYLHRKDLGFRKDQVLTFQLPDSFARHITAFKDEVLRSPDVVAATAGYGLPGDIYATDAVTLPRNGGKSQTVVLFNGDEDYVKTLGLQLVAGRDFSKDMPTDASSAFLINESAVREFGYGTPQGAIGQPIDWETWSNEKPRPVKKGQVIGVVRDFHYQSLHEKVTPLLVQIWPEYYKMAVKVRAGNMDRAIAHIKTAWGHYVPDPLDYSFLDAGFGAMYHAEEKLASLLWIFTGMAILIGCMGLFGLAAYAAEQRTKEIGIRKVLGASLLDLTTLLSRNFVLLVLLATLLAFPVAWWAMNKWLADFSYRTSLSWWVFVLAAVGVLLIALLTVCFQTLKAALRNPVTTLRTE